MHKVLAYQIADSIDIQGIKSSFTGNLKFNDSSELFYESATDQYIYIFKYGVVSFFNFNQPEINTTIKFIRTFCRNTFSTLINDELSVQTGSEENKIGYNKIEIITPDPETVRMIMLNVSQSVALDHYTDQTDKLLEETNNYTLLLEKKGRLVLSRRNLKKHIGKTLLLKNKIAENLYIFDSPPETWEDEKLDKLNRELSKNLEIQERFRSVANGLGIVKENLELFRDLLQYRNSTFLEWIVIILIAIEVINFLVEKLFM